MKPINHKWSKRITEYLNLQTACCKPSTMGTYRTSLVHFHDFLKHRYRCNTILKTHIARLTKLDLQNFIRFLNDLKLVPYSRVNYLLAVKKYLAWETDKGTVDERLLDTLDRKLLPKVPEYLPKPLSPNLDRNLQSQWRQDTSRYAKCFLLLRLTGLRISELINLTNDCVVTNARNEQFLKVPLGKMDNERLVPLTSESLDIIAHMKSTSPHDADPNRLIGFVGPVHSVYYKLKHQLDCMTKGIVDQGKPVTPHRLRHTCATSLLAGGMGIVSIMKFLGHRRIEMSLRYAKVTPSLLRNEYLKALANIELKLLTPQQRQASMDTLSIAPHELIAQIAAFILKEATLDPKQRKNLAKRLARLKSVIEKIPLTKKFPIPT